MKRNKVEHTHKLSLPDVEERGVAKHWHDDVRWDMVRSLGNAFVYNCANNARTNDDIRIVDEQHTGHGTTNIVLKNGEWSVGGA